MRRTMMVAAAMAMLVLGASATASAQTVRLTAVLSGANEVPPLAAGTGAAGSAEVFVNLATRVLTYEVKVFNMPTNTTAGHFHVGGPGLAGPVVVNLAPPAVNDDFTLRGSANGSAFSVRADQGIRTWDDFIQALVGGQVYVNIHSVANGGGEIRGQLVPVDEQ
jgi:hypothetical protein